MRGNSIRRCLNSTTPLSSATTILLETISREDFTLDVTTTTTSARMTTTCGGRGWRSLDELFQFAEQFPILVELWALDARIPRNTRQPATQVVRIMQIKPVRLACPSVRKLLDKCHAGYVLRYSRRSVESYSQWYPFSCWESVLCSLEFNC